MFSVKQKKRKNEEILSDLFVYIEDTLRKECYTQVGIAVQPYTMHVCIHYLV